MTLTAKAPGLGWHLPQGNTDKVQGDSGVTGLGWDPVFLLPTAGGRLSALPSPLPSHGGG